MSEGERSKLAVSAAALVGQVLPVAESLVR